MARATTSIAVFASVKFINYSGVSMADTVYPQSLDSIFSASGVGSLDKALTNTIYGLDYQQNRAMTKSNRDQQGYVFMTRPQLNLQKDNLRNYRELYPLLDE